MADDKWKRTGPKTRVRVHAPTQMQEREETARSGSIYQPDDGREPTGTEQVLVPGARQNYLDKKIRDAGG